MAVQPLAQGQILQLWEAETSSLLEVPQSLGNRARDEAAGYFHAEARIYSIQNC